MAVTPVSNASGSGTSGTASVTRGTVSDGDLMFLYLLCSDPTATPTDPAGWTRIGTNQSDTTATADCVTALYRRVASGEPASYSITLAIGTAGWSLLHLAFSGQDTTTPINASNQSGDTALSTHVTASITPTVANCLIVSFFGLDGGGGGHAHRRRRGHRRGGHVHHRRRALDGGGALRHPTRPLLRRQAHVSAREEAPCPSDSTTRT
jgi:hypothetical protein